MATCYKNVNISMVQLYSDFSIFVLIYHIYSFTKNTIISGMGIYLYFMCLYIKSNISSKSLYLHMQTLLHFKKLKRFPPRQGFPQHFPYMLITIWAFTYRHYGIWSDHILTELSPFMTCYIWLKRFCTKILLHLKWECKVSFLRWGRYQMDYLQICVLFCTVVEFWLLHYDNLWHNVIW